jgi:hypothetical protein
VFRAIQHPDFKAAMPRGRNSAPLPILIATPTDKLSRVFADADRIGKHVAVVVAESRNTFAVVTLTSRVMKTNVGEHPDDCMLHPNSELGMLLVYLRDVNPVARCRFTAPTRKIELVDNGRARVA